MKHGSLVLLFAAPLLAQKPVAVEASVKIADLSNRQAMPPVSPLSETVTLAANAPAGVAAPAGVTASWYGAIKIGGRNVNVVVGKQKAEAERVDTLAIDADGDGRFADAEKLALEVSEVAGRGGGPAGERAKPVDVAFGSGDRQLPAKASYMKAGGGDPVVGLQFLSYLEARTQIGGAERVIAIVDKNLDGTYGSPEDLWMLAKAGDRPAAPFALSLLTERRFLDGQLVGIQVKDRLALEVTAVPAKGPDAKDAAAHRVRVEHQWAERFDKEREEFVKARKMDTARPRADHPVEWHYVTFDEAIALGKQAGKPVFVDVMAFWCVWCYRMDYYTYIDKQVADTLNGSFVPCKIIQEQDLVGDYDAMMKKLEARGIPAMGIFDGDGGKLHTIGGWKDPVAFLEELAKGTAAFAGKK